VRRAAPGIQHAERKALQDRWNKHAVIYEVSARAFQNSNADQIPTSAG
jgi:hypothetical protein